jgi:hypothetical protein
MNTHLKVCSTLTLALEMAGGFEFKSSTCLWYLRGDAANAVLAAVGYTFRHLIRAQAFVCQILIALMATLQPAPA